MPRPLLRTFRFYGDQLPLFTLLVGMSLLVHSGFAIQQHLFGMAVDQVQRGEAVVRLPDGSLDSAVAWWWVWILIAVAGGRGLLLYLQQILGMVVGQRLLHSLRDRVLGQVQRLDHKWHREHGSGEVITRTTRDSDKVRDAVVIGTRQMLDVALMVTGVLILLAWYHPMLALVPAALITLAVLIMIKLGDRLVVLNRSADDSYDVVTQHLTESVAGVRVIKAFGLEERRVNSFIERLSIFMRRAAHALGWGAVRLPIPQAIVSLSHGWLLGYGGWLVSQGELTVGELVAALMLMTGVIFRSEAIARVVRIFSDARASAARLWEILDAEPEVVSGTQALPEGPLGVRLDRVTLGGERKVLDDLSLALAPGEVVAIVGATGSGKSSLAALLPRLRDPDCGTVSIGNDTAGWIDVREVQLDTLRQRVQLVAQTSFLFSTTIADNLRLGRACDDEALWAAMRAAAADDFVSQLDAGLKTVVGERGVTLSGGQRQRLCLARALLADPSVLVLDDSTSAVDASTEQHILNALRSAGREASVLVIASRISSILLADRVCILSDGRLVEEGTHAELAKRSTTYRELLCIDEDGHDEVSNG